jgi:hypothetical protein
MSPFAGPALDLEVRRVIIHAPIACHGFWPCARVRFRNPPGFRVGWYTPFRGKRKDMSIPAHCESKFFQPAFSQELTLDE